MISSWTKRKIEQYNNDITYFKENNMFPIADKAIVRVDAVDDDSNDYKDKTGMHFMDENTLILGTTTTTYI